MGGDLRVHVIRHSFPGLAYFFYGLALDEKMDLRG